MYMLLPKKTYILMRHSTCSTAVASSQSFTFCSTSGSCNKWVCLFSCFNKSPIILPLNTTRGLLVRSVRGAAQTTSSMPVWVSSNAPATDPQMDMVVGGGGGGGVAAELSREEDLDVWEILRGGLQ